jgi:hypothetical protein
MTTNVRQVVRQVGGERVLLALASPAPAAFVTLWGVLAVSILADPARPYTDGAWTTFDLISLGLVGGIVGLLSRPVAAAVGIPLGLAAAVALHSYNLAAVVFYYPQVGSRLTGPEWTPAVVGALLAGFAAIVVGYLLGRGIGLASRISRGARGLAIIRAGDRTGPGSPAVVALVATLAAPIAAIAVGVLLVGGSLLPTAESAYVSAGGQPTAAIQVVIRGNEIVTVEPASIPAGWAHVVIARGTAESSDLWLTRPLPGYVLERRLTQEEILIHNLGPALSQSSRPVDLRWPGTYALVLTPPPGGPVGNPPVSDSRLLTVTAAPAGVLWTSAGGDGGKHMTLPFIAGLGIEGWAAAGMVLLWLNRIRKPAWPTERRVLVAVLVGAFSAYVLGSLTLFAIDLLHNPF